MDVQKQISILIHFPCHGKCRLVFSKRIHLPILSQSIYLHRKSVSGLPVSHDIANCPRCLSKREQPVLIATLNFLPLHLSV